MSERPSSGQVGRDIPFVGSKLLYSDDGTVYVEVNNASALPVRQIPGGSGSDAFGRLRIASPETLFDSKGHISANLLSWDDAQTNGSGTSSTHDSDRASVTLAVGATTEGARVRQTKRRFPYQPGKSQLCLFTFVMGSTAQGVTKRVGAFDEENGFFLQNAGGSLSFGIRSYVVGTSLGTDTLVAQTAWDDKMDGSGLSGITLDKTKAQIFFVDFQWLGVGSVRFGFVINGSMHVLTGNQESFYASMMIREQL